jgi:hypothetical protein
MNSPIETLIQAQKAHRDMRQRYLLQLNQSHNDEQKADLKEKIEEIDLYKALYDKAINELRKADLF